MTKAQSCRTCVYWDKPPKQRALEGFVYPCTAPIPDARYPASVEAKFRRSYMERNDGKNCLCWKEKS